MKTKYFQQLFIVIMMVLILLVSTSGVAYAVEIIEGGTIPESQVVDDDVFIGGDMVVVDGTVNGDLFAAGNSVVINGTVNGSLVVAAQTIQVNGKVTGSIYGASSALSLGENLEVGRNVYYAGYGLETKKGSVINRDLLVAGYQAVLFGKVGRDVQAAVGALHLNGEVGRDVKAEVSSPTEDFAGNIPFMTPPGAPAMVAAGLHVSDSAKIGGSLTYTSKTLQSEAIKSEPSGGVVYQTPQPSQTMEEQKPSVKVEQGIGRWIITRLRDLATLLVLGALALWLIPNTMQKVTERARTEPLPSAGWGTITIIIGYAGAFMLALSIIALAVFLGVLTLGGLAKTVFGIGFSTLGLAFTIFSLLISYGSKLVISLLVGKLLLQKIAPKIAEHKVWPLMVGVIIYVMIRSIPFLGWLVGVAVTLVGFGAMWLIFKDRKLAQAPVKV
jgi:cytoskeletal protein CcmA (bactofilin family)